MNTGKKIHILIGLSCVVLIGIVFISLYRHNQTNQAPPVVVSPSEKILNKSNPAPPLPPPPGKSTLNKNNMPVTAVEQPAKTDSQQVAQETQLTAPTVGEQIQRILGLRNQPSEESIKTLTAFLDNDDPAIVSEAIDALGHLGFNSKFEEMVFDILKQRAKDKNFSGRGDALITAAMFKMDEQLLAILPDFLTEKGDMNEANVRIAVRALSFVESQDLLPYLHKIIDQTKMPQTQKIAYGIMAKLNSVESIEFLEDKLASSDEFHQRTSTWALSRTNNPEYNQLLGNALSNGQLGNASIALLATSPSAPEVFANILSDNDIEKDQKISYLNSIALNTVNAPSDVRYQMTDALEPLLNSNDKDLEIEAIRTLGKIGGSKDTANLLTPKLQSTDEEVRKQAFFSYIAYTTPETYKPLVNLLWDDNQRVRRGAMAIAGNFMDESDVDQLNKALEHDDEFIKEHAQLILNGL